MHICTGIVINEGERFGIAASSVSKSGAWVSPNFPQVKVDGPDGVHPLLEALYYFFALINLMCNMAPRQRPWG